MKKIKSICVEGMGYIYAERQLEHHHDPNIPKGEYVIKKDPIEVFTVNGEMAPVPWYRQGDKEWNGKYVIQVEYYPDPEKETT